MKKQILEYLAFCCILALFSTSLSSKEKSSFTSPKYKKYDYRINLSKSKEKIIKIIYKSACEYFASFENSESSNSFVAHYEPEMSGRYSENFHLLEEKETPSIYGSSSIKKKRTKISSRREFQQNNNEQSEIIIVYHSDHNQSHSQNCNTSHIRKSSFPNRRSSGNRSGGFSQRPPTRIISPEGSNSRASFRNSPVSGAGYARFNKR